MFKSWGTVAANEAKGQGRGETLCPDPQLSTVSYPECTSGVDLAWCNEELHVLANLRFNVIVHNCFEDN